MTILKTCVFLLILLQTLHAAYSENLLLKEGSWTWPEAKSICSELNGRLAKKTDINIEFMEERNITFDQEYWISNETTDEDCLPEDIYTRNWTNKNDSSSFDCRKFCSNYSRYAVKDTKCLCIPNNQTLNNNTKCTNGTRDQYTIFDNIENPPKCKVMQLSLTKITNSGIQLRDCTHRAGFACKAGKFKAFEDMNSSRSEAETLCQNISSSLVNLDLIDDTQARTENITDGQYLWTGGIVQRGQIGVFEIRDCIQVPLNLSHNAINLSRKLTDSYIDLCANLCENSSMMALMESKCLCLSDSDYLQSDKVPGCLEPCFPWTAQDRCGGKNQFSVYRRYNVTKEMSMPGKDVCQALWLDANGTRVNVTWPNCQEPLDGYVCRNVTQETEYTGFYDPNTTWEKARYKCEDNGMILASYNENYSISIKGTLSNTTMQMWTGVYSPTRVTFRSGIHLGKDDRCIAVKNFNQRNYEVKIMDCDVKLGFICQTASGFYDASESSNPNITTTNDEGITMSEVGTPTLGFSETSVPSSTEKTRTTTVGMSPMIIGLICTVVFVALVLTIILAVLGVLLYRFREQKRQLNMLKGPTISYSNLEHSVVVSYNGSPPRNSLKDSQMDDMASITEKLDAQFVKNDNMNEDEKSEHLYDVSENDINSSDIKTKNNSVSEISHRKRMELPQQTTVEDRVYTEVSICEDKGTPIVQTNDKNKEQEATSDSCLERVRKESQIANASISEKILKVEDEDDTYDDLDNKQSDKVDDTYDHAKTFTKSESKNVMKQVRNDIDDEDNYDELNKSFSKQTNTDSDSLYDRVNNLEEEGCYSELDDGIKKQRTNHYEDLELPFDLP